MDDFICTYKVIRGREIIFRLPIISACSCIQKIRLACYREALFNSGQYLRIMREARFSIIYTRQEISFGF